MKAGIIGSGIVGRVLGTAFLKEGYVFLEGRLFHHFSIQLSEI